MIKEVLLASLAFGLLFGSCNQKDSLSKLLLPQITTAYEKADWETIIALSDSLLAHGDSAKGLWLFYAEALAATNQTDKSLKIINERLAEDSTDYYAFHSLGNVYAIREEYEKAIENYTKAIEIRPTYARPYVYRADIYKHLGMKTEAINSYMDAVYLFEENEFYDEVGLYSSRVIELDSTHTRALSFLAHSYERQERYCDAASCLLEVFRLEGEKEDVRIFETSYFLGQNLYKCGEFGTAINYLELSIQGSSSDYHWSSYCYLASSYNKLNNMEQYSYYQKTAEGIDDQKTDDHINRLLTMEFER